MMGIRIDGECLFICALPIWIIFRGLKIHFKRKRKVTFSIKREVLLNIFFVYILCVLSLTVFPIDVMFYERRKGYFGANLVPMINTYKDFMRGYNEVDMRNFMIRFWIENIFGNLALLAPFGVIVPMLWKKINKFSKMLLLSFCVSISIEIYQLITSYLGIAMRSCDIDDVILNVLGASLGYLLYKLVHMGIIHKRKADKPLVKNL